MRPWAGLKWINLVGIDAPLIQSTLHTSRPWASYPQPPLPFFGGGRSLLSLLPRPQPRG